MFRNSHEISHLPGGRLLLPPFRVSSDSVQSEQLCSGTPGNYEAPLMRRNPLPRSEALTLKPEDFLRECMGECPIGVNFRLAIIGRL